MKLEDIVKMQNTANKPISFVPHGQNFTYTIGSGETLEFRSKGAFYYKKQLDKGLVVTTQDHYDTPSEYFYWTNVQLEELVEGSGYYGIEFDYPAIDANGRVIESGEDIENTQIEMTISNGSGESQTIVLNYGEESGVYGWFYEDSTMVLLDGTLNPNTGVVEEATGKGLIGIGEVDFAPIVTLTIQNVTPPTPGLLNAINNGDSLTGFQVNADALTPKEVESFISSVFEAGDYEFASFSGTDISIFAYCPKPEVKVFRAMTYSKKIEYSSDTVVVGHEVLYKGWSRVDDLGHRETNLSGIVSINEDTVTNVSNLTDNETWLALNGVLFGGIAQDN